MKIKSLFLTAAVLLTALSSCNKDEGRSTIDLNGESEVYLKARMGSQLLDTKAATDAVQDGTAVVFGDGLLVFADASDNITKIIEISGTSGSNGAITKQNLESGVLIGGIPNASNRIFLFANLPAANHTAAMSATSLAALEASTMAMDILDQTDTNFGITQASLYGSAGLVPTSDPQIREANFVVSPLISRIELDEVKIDGTDVIKATLEGIFINNYVDELYPNAKIAGTLVNNGQDRTKYAMAGTGSYTTATQGYTFDVPTGLSMATPNLSVTATPKETWGYNVFAAGIPHVVLKLSNVEVNDGTGAPRVNGDGGAAGEAYVTVKGFVDSKTSKEVDAFEGGKVYKIKTLLLDDKDFITDIPEPSQDNVSVRVVVDIVDWTVVDSTPILDK